MFGFLRRNLKIGSQKIKESDYKAMIRLILEYASSVWDPHTKISICGIEMAQRKAARLTLNRLLHLQGVKPEVDFLFFFFFFFFSLSLSLFPTIFSATLRNTEMTIIIKYFDRWS